jgi:predicted RNA binding protein YcfA (HicA-like mRNA interferase family)
MTSVKFRELIRLLEDDGWRVVGQRGSHRQYEHPTKPGKVMVAGKPNADVPKAQQRISFVKRDCGGQADE